jgi:uncharacterized protein (DUF1330 family)
LLENGCCEKPSLTGNDHTPRFIAKLLKRRIRKGEKPMPKAYWVTVYRSISDPQKVAAYAKLAPAATGKFGARYIARGTANEAFEAGQKERIVISEFPSLANAIDAYNSPDYQAALKVLADGAVRDIRIIEAAE